MITPEQALKLARDAFDTSTTYFDASIRAGLEGDIRRWQSRHAAGSKYTTDAWKARSSLFRPKTRAMIQKGEAMAAEAFFSNEDITSVVPMDDSDPVQRIAAEVAEALLEHHLQFSIPSFVTVCGGMQDASVAGLVCSRNGWDKKKDKPFIKLLPLENVRFDPGADWNDPVNTSPYFIEMIAMYVGDVKMRMKDGVEGKWKVIDETKIKAAMSKTWDTVRMTREHGRQDSKDQTPAYNDFAIVWVHRNIIRIEGEDYVYYTLGTTEVLSDPVPLKDVVPGGKRDYTMGSVLIETHKTYPSGKSRIVKDSQDEVNEVSNQRLDNVKFVLNKRYFGKRNAQVDIRSLMRNVPGSMTLMNDPEKDVRVVETPDVTSSAFAEHDRLNMDFDDVAGAFSSSSVQANRSLNETVGGMSLFSSGANLVTGYGIRVFAETWWVPTLEQIKECVIHYETNDDLLKIAGKKSQALQQVIAKMAEDLGQDPGAISVDIDRLLMETPTRVKLNMSMNAISPMTKMQTLAYAMDMITKALKDGTLQGAGMDIQELIKEVMAIAGYKDGDRFFSTEEEDPRVAALTAQVQELTAAMEAKNPPELIAAQVDKIRAEIKNIQAAYVKTGVEAAYAAMQAAGVIALTPATAPIADAVMQSAGYQQPVPAGVDPNFPVSDAALSAPAETPVVPVRQNTSPALPPVPQQADAGAQQGIETQRLDA